MNRMRSFVRGPWLLVVVLVVLFLVPVFVKNPYMVDLMLMIFLFTIFATCVYQVAVVNRLIFGASSFVGIGAYTSAILVMNFGMPYWPAMILAGVAAAVFALVIGVPILRVSGIYFAIITWSLTEVLVTVYKGVPFFGGVDGIHYIPPPAIGNMAFSGRTPYYYLALVLMLVALAFFYRLQKSRFGRDLKVIGNSEVLASALGVNVPKYRLICFVIACFFLGLGGSFYAHYVTSIEPQFFGINLTSNIFAFSVIGGIGNLWGGLLGTVVMTVIPEWMHAFENMRPLTYGIMIMFVMVFMPGGFISLPKQVRLWRKGKIRE